MLIGLASLKPCLAWNNIILKKYTGVILIKVEVDYIAHAELSNKETTHIIIYIALQSERESFRVNGAESSLLNINNVLGVTCTNM